MKKFFILFALLCCMSSCIGRQQPTSGSLTSEAVSVVDTISEEIVTSDIDNMIPYNHEQNVAISAPLIVDTIIGEHRIRYKRLANEIIIRYDTIQYSDNSLFVDIEYQGKKIIKNHEFRTSDFSAVIPIDDHPEYELYSPHIVQIADSCVIFDIGIWMPDTDVGYSIELTIKNDGTYSYRELIPEDEEEAEVEGE